MTVCVISSECRAATGGLAAYTRGLVRELSAASHVVSVLARYDRDLPGPLNYADGRSGTGRPVDGIPTRLTGPRAWCRPWLPRLRHLTSRPRLRQWAPRLFGMAYGPSVDGAVPPDVDVVHYVGTGFELLGFTALSVARRRRAKFTVWPAVHPGTWGDSPLDVDLYQQADAVFCQSDDEVRHLAQLGVDPARLVRAWLAPAAPPTGDGRRFRDQHRLGDRPLVLFIARKFRSKGFHALCEAMAAVLASVPDACLVVVGADGDPPYPPLPAGACLDLGPTDDAEKADALAATDVFCMPSAAESFGIVYVEAWSYGKPVVGGPAPAVRELIEDGITGFTVEQQPDAVAAVLIRLLADLATRDRLGTAGRNLQRTRYTWPAVIDLHVRVFARVASHS